MHAYSVTSAVEQLIIPKIAGLGENRRGLLQKHVNKKEIEKNVSSIHNDEIPPGYVLESACY